MTDQDKAPAEENLDEATNAPEENVEEKDKTPTEENQKKNEDVDFEEEEEKKQNLFEQMFRTTRSRKKTKKMNTQRYIPISEIRNDTVILKNGGLRSILAVEPINFNLKSETEQIGIIAGYENFINTITFPLQIVVNSTKVNIDPYIEQIRSKALLQENELLKEHAYSYAMFIEKLVDVADIMQKRFYVVVPQDDAPAKHSPLESFLTWMKIDDSGAKITQRNRRFIERSNILKDRTNLVQSGLHNVGLISRRLSTQELIEMYYSLYNPGTSQEQKLPVDLNTQQFTL